MYTRKLPHRADDARNRYVIVITSAPTLSPYSGMTTPKFRRALRKTRTGLSQPSNRSLFAAPIPAGKRFGEARDRAGIFRDDCIFCATETGRSRVSGAKAPGSQRLFLRRPEGWQD